MKACSKCKIEKPIASFAFHKHTKDRRRHECRDCIGVWRRAHRKMQGPQYDKKHALKRFYKITIEDFEAMMEAQKGLCAICKTDKPGGRWNILCVDHDHETKQVRGLLCQNCNQGLGFFKDNVKSLASAIQYLSSSKGGI